jgi:hypothetical protein
MPFYIALLILVLLFVIDQDAELLQIVDSAWTEAVEIANSSDGWKQEKKNDHGDVVVSKKNKKGNF